MTAMTAPHDRQIRSALPALPVAVLASVLADLGWEVQVFDIDLHQGVATVEIHRSDGRWIWLHADGLGRVSLERWRRSDRMVTYRGLPMVMPHDEFLGRRRLGGVRSAFRALADYLGANPAPEREALPDGRVRASMRLVLNAAALPVPSDASWWAP